MAIPRKMRLPAGNFHGRVKQAVNTQYFSLKLRDNGMEGARIGIVAGTAVHKSAVKRNFWRRQAGETLRGLHKAYGDIVLVIYPKVNTLTKEQFRKKLSAAAAELISKA